MGNVIFSFGFARVSEVRHIELLFKGPVYLNYRGIWWTVISSPSWIVELKEKLTNKTQVDDISEDDDENESTSLLLLFGFLVAP